MPMRRLTAPKINSFYVQIGRLLFLPSSTSALVAVILAGLTFGFLLFPIFIFSYFSFVILLFFLIFGFFIVIFVYFFFIFKLLFVIYLVWLLSKSLVPNSSVGWLSRHVVLFCWWLWSSYPPFASFMYSSPCLFSPVPVSIIFPCFYFLDFFLVFAIISSIWAYHVACARFAFQIFARAGRTRAICRMRGLSRGEDDR